MTLPKRFNELLSLVDAWAWLDACPDVPALETVPLQQALGRVLAAQIICPEDRPDRVLVLADGYAVRAESTLGASSYNPLFLSIVPMGSDIRAECASVCHAGETLPPGADAILPLHAGEPTGTALAICDTIARGSGVAHQGQAARRGDVAIPAGRRLAVPHIALAASLGVTHLTVRRRLDVTVVIAGAKPPGIEALSLALSALVARDSGLAHIAHCRGDVRGTLSSAAATDVVLLVGRSGWGEDDHAARAVALAGGRIDHHGLALTPGGSAGLGLLGDAPLLLLPGDPLAALATYELLAGRLLRRLAGRAAAWPCQARRFTLSRKIASPVGISEWVPVVCDGSSVEPVALAPADGLLGYARADGFLVVPAGLEGYAPGELVDIIPHRDTPAGKALT